MPRPMKPLRSRGGLTYEKSALTEAELLERWIERGLVLVDQERAARYVRLSLIHISEPTRPY